MRRIFAFSGDLHGHAHVRILVDVEVAVAVEVADDRHARFFLYALDQALSAARDDDVDVLRHARKHVAHRCAIRRRDELNARLREPSRTQARKQSRMDRAIGIHAFRTTAKNDGVARLQAQRTSVRRYVRTTLVDDAHYAQRHAHALDVQAIRPIPLGSHSTDRIRQGNHFFDRAGNTLDALLVEFEAIE